MTSQSHRPARLLQPLAIVCILIAGCSSTSVTGVWRSPQYKGPAFKSIFTAAATSRSQIRRTFEDDFAKQLAARGATGVPSYTILPQDNQVPVEQFVQAVKQSGAQAALIVRLVDKHMESSSQTTGGGYYNGMGTYYPGAWGGTTSTYSYEVYSLEAKLFNAADHSLVWSASLETADPLDSDKEVATIAKKIADALIKAGLL